MLKRDLSYNLFSRELQALDELSSREPEDLAKWAGFARDHYIAKRDTPPPTPSPSPPPGPPRTPSHVLTPAQTEGLHGMDRVRTASWGPSPLRKTTTTGR